MLEFICGTAIGITSTKIYTKYDFVKKFCDKINIVKMIKEDIKNSNFFNDFNNLLFLLNRKNNI